VLRVIICLGIPLLEDNKQLISFESLLIEVDLTAISFIEKVSGKLTLKANVSIEFILIDYAISTFRNNILRAHPLAGQY
jgi:hypothetical protein